MPVCVTIGNCHPVGSLLVPRMAQHGLKPTMASDGEYTRFVGENPLPKDLLQMGLEQEFREFLQHPIKVTVERVSG